MLLLPQRDDAVIVALELLGGVDGLLVGGRQEEHDAWRLALLASRRGHLPGQLVGIVPDGDHLVLTDLHGLAGVLADGHGLDGLTQALAPCAQRNNILRRLNEPPNFVLIAGELLAQLLHLLEQALPVLKLEVGLGKVVVEDLLLGCHPVLGHLALVEEAVAGVGVLEVGLQAEGELEQPGPLVLHGCHVGINDLHQTTI